MKREPKDIYVLIACEESQVECRTFRAHGFTAFSCDIQKCGRSQNPDWHIQDDVTPFLDGATSFFTQSGIKVNVPGWNLIVAHPPCTYLCKQGAVHMVKNGCVQLDRFEKMLAAREFFIRCLNAKADYLAVENPLPMARAKLPKPSCYVQPYWYGHEYSKKTLYWLRNLPPLMPTIINPEYRQFVRASRGKYRSRTFTGVAEAMATQWGQYILNDL